MRGAFCVQHWLTAARHHSALRREARTGFPPTSTKIGLVCADGSILTATQLLFSIATSNATSRTCPSASTFFRATASPFTTSSTGTSRVSPMRARSTSQ
jgi:hypothetical protein